MRPGDSRTARRRSAAAFTMVEIAIALAIIAFALVAIIGILPSGLTVQRESREKTIINSDAQYLLDTLRDSRGPIIEYQPDLTNFVEGVSNEFGFRAPFARDWEIIGSLNLPGTNQAVVRAITGTASDRREDDEGFGLRYLLTVEVAPLWTARMDHPDRDVLLTNAWDLRLVFQWPYLPNGTVGLERAVYRSLVGGPLEFVNTNGQVYAFFGP